MSTVYVVQNHHRLARDGTSRLEPAYDLSPAARFGRLHFLLGPNANPLSNLDVLIEQMAEPLTDFCDSDYLLLVGSPVLIGIATTLAARANAGRVPMLQWHGRQRQYQEVVAEIYNPLRGD